MKPGCKLGTGYITHHLVECDALRLVNSDGIRHHQGELFTAAGLILESELLPYTQDRDYEPSSLVSKLLSVLGQEGWALVLVKGHHDNQRRIF